MLNIDNVIEEAILLAGSLLKELTNDLDFENKLKLAFGNDIETDVLKETLGRGQLDFPDIEIVNSADINNANGAYAKATNKIYLAQEFLSVNRNNINEIASVILEEYGHFADSQLNNTDAPGDEGAIFAALVRGKELNKSELQQLRHEDDTAVVVLDGKDVEIEQENNIQLETLNFSGSNINLSKGLFSKQRYSKELVGQPIKFDSSGFKLDAKFGIEPFIEIGGLSGKANFNYPVNLNLSLPQSVQPDTKFSIDTSSFFIGDTSLSGEGNVIPNLGIDFILEMGESGIENEYINLKTDGKNTKINLVTLSPASFEVLANTPFQLKFQPQIQNIDIGNHIPLLKDTLQLGLSSPNSIILEKTKDKSKVTLNQLENIQASGSETFLSFQADIDRFIANVLQAIPEPTTKAFGLALEKLNSKEEFDDSRFGLGDFSYELGLLNLTGDAGLALQQDLEFIPDNVKVRMSLNDKQIHEGFLGDSIEFTAPSQEAGVIELQTQYELLGELQTEFGIVFKGSVEAEAGEFEFKSKLGKWKEFKYGFGPLYEKKILEGTSEPFFTFLATKTDISDIKGINTEFTSTYYIPYGDGSEDTEEADIVDSQGDKLGEVALTLPTYVLDGNAEYTVALSSSGAGIQYNFAYIIDVSGSMDSGGLLDAQNAYVSLTNSLIDNGVADVSQFAVIPFASSAYTVGPISSTDTKSTIQELNAFGYTNFNAALTEAKDFFSGLPAGATNIAYFLSDGVSNRGGSFTSRATELQNLADVRAYGIGSADLNALNIVDSNSAVFLTDPSDLETEFTSSGLSRNDISQINIILDNNVVEIIQPNQLKDSPLGLSFSGELKNLSIASDAENKVTAEVIFTDNRPNTIVDFTVTSGSGTGTATDQDDKIRLGATELAIDGGNGNDEIVGNYIGNTLNGGDGNDVIFGNDGDDRILPGTGDDRVDGGDGIDTVEYPDITFQESSVNKVGGVVTVDIGNTSTFLNSLVVDSFSADISTFSNNLNIELDKDIGIDTLTNVEYIQFADTRISSTTLEIVPILQIADISIAEQNAKSHVATITYNLSSATDKEVRFLYTTVDDTTIANLDYISEAGEVVIPVGETTGSLEIEIFGDTEIESDETFNLAFSNLSGATFENNELEFNTTVEIENDDLEASLALLPSDIIQIEANEGLTEYSFNIARIDNIVGETTVKYNIIGSGENPVEAADFANGVLPSGTITFADGETEKEIKFNVLGDKEIEADEEFSIALSNPSQNAKIITEELTGFVLNDDEPIPAIVEIIEVGTFLSKSENDENKELSFTVNRTGNTKGETVVQYSVEGISENPVEAADFANGMLPSGTITFADGETSKKITFNIVDDVNAENNEGFILTLDSTADATEILTSGLTGTIEDDDSTLQVIDSIVFSDEIIAFYFNQDLNEEVLSLYGSENLPDITVKGEKTGTVNGSLIWNEEINALGFIKTGKFLEPDKYTATLFSRENAIVQVGGEILDGDLDGNSGGDYQFEFTIEEKSDRILSIPDITIAPGETTDISLTLDNAEEVTQAQFDLYYDPDLLEINAINLNDSLPTNWQLTDSEIDKDNGVVRVTIEGTDALTGSNLNLVSLATVVPDTAKYGATQILDLENVFLNDGLINVVDDDAIHSVGKTGDVSGDGTLSGLDAYQMMRVSVGLDDGFDNFATVDPILMADMNDDNVISALDAFYANAI